MPGVSSCPSWCSSGQGDALAQAGVPVARGSVGYVILGAQFAVAKLDAQPAPSADKIAKAFLTALFGRAASVGVTLDTDAELAIQQWISPNVAMLTKAV